MEQDKKVCCINCKEEINHSNTQTDLGWEEAQISGLCEKCFDDATFDMYQDVTHLDEGIIGVLGDGVVLAGGSLRSLVDSNDNINDYDLFFTDMNKVQSVKEYLVNSNYDLIFQCPVGELSSYFNKVTKTKVQLVQKKEYKDCNTLIDSFDITACCCAYDGHTLFYNKRFVFDNLNKLININNVEYPVATMKRIAKYITYGFRLTSEASKCFVESVNLMNLTEDNTALYID